jgi:hypothetical protein
MEQQPTHEIAGDYYVEHHGRKLTIGFCKVMMNSFTDNDEVSIYMKEYWKSVLEYVQGKPDYDSEVTNELLIKISVNKIVIG